MHTKKIISLVLFFLFFAAIPYSQAQQPLETELVSKHHYDLSIIQVFPDSFPVVSVVFQAKDELGNPLKLLRKDELSVKEAGIPADILSLKNITENEPIKIAIILDKSSSMLIDENQIDNIWTFNYRNPPKGYVAPIDYAKQGIQKFIEGGELEQDSLQLIGFNEKVDQISEFTNDQKTLLKFLKKMKADGATAFYDAVEVAVKSLSELEGEKVIIALTDGVDNSSHIKLDSVGQFAKSAGIPIYAIGLGRADSTSLNKLTSMTSGFSYFTNDPQKLAEIYLQIKKQIRSIYELRYQSQALDNLAESRDVEVYFTNDSSDFNNPDFQYQLPSTAKKFLEERKATLELRNNLLIGGGAFVLLGLTAFLILRKKESKIVKAYPNPFDDAFTVDYTLSGKEGQLQVLDENSNEVYATELTEGTQHTIEGKDWKTGTYLVRIASGKKLSKVVRVVKR